MPDGSIRKVKKRVINPQAAERMLAANKIKGSTKFMYFDEKGNLVILDSEPSDSSK